MSLFIRIICESSNSITPTEVIELFAKVGIMVESVADTLNARSSFPPDGIRLVGAATKNPITIYYASLQRTRLDMELLIESLTDCAVPDEVRHCLQNATQILDIEINPDAIDETTWESIDQIEGYISYKYHGIIYVGGEGFYDHELRLLLSTK